MKRIAAHIGLTSFCALAAAFYLPEKATFYVMQFSALAAVLFLLIKKTRRIPMLPVTAIVIAVSCGVNLAYSSLVVTPIQDSLRGEKRQINATLVDEPYKMYSKYYYRLETDTVDDEDVQAKILLKTARPIDIEPFDKITFTADISNTVKDYYLAKGYYVTVDKLHFPYYLNNIEDKPLYYHAILLRQSMREAIESYLPIEDAGLCNAILIGDKYGLDTTVKNDFRIIGASHFIVVSGMHFSILCILCLFVFSKLFRRQWLYYPMTIAVILLYMMLTGFQPSVMRSGVMMLILIFGKWIMRRSDALTSLGVAGIAMPFIFSPYGCGDIGMILSFAATYSIIKWHSPIFSKLRIKAVSGRWIFRQLIKFGNVIISMISTCLAAEILVFPLSVFLFKGFSPMVLLSSVLLYPLIWLMMAFSLGVCVFAYLGPLSFVSQLFSWPLYWSAKLTLWLVKTLSTVPFAYIHVRSLWFFIWITVTLVLGLTAYILRNRYRLYPAVILLSALVFFGGITVNTAVQLQTNRLEFLAGKKGAAICLNRCGRLHILRFDCNRGTAYQAMSDFEDDYGAVESAVCTSYTERVNYSRMSYRELDVAHYLVYKNVKELEDNDSPDEVFYGSSKFILDDGVVLDTCESKGKTLLYLTSGERSVLLLPTGFSYDAIPDEMRSPDIIVMNKQSDHYDQLECDSLIFCGKDNIDKSKPIPKYNSLYNLSDGSASFDMN